MCRPEKINEGSDTLRGLAAELRTQTDAVPWYGLFELLRIVRKKSAMYEAYSNLIGLSNGMGSQGNSNANERRIRNVENLLGIKVPS